jgi:hypothetical protein
MSMLTLKDNKEQSKVEKMPWEGGDKPIEKNTEWIGRKVPRNIEIKVYL